jgi:hypothetical protein
VCSEPELKSGHFSLGGADRRFDPAREALARALVREGMR